MTQEQITDLLVAAGIPAERIDWRPDQGYFRYGYWNQLPPQAYAAIAEWMSESLYEDDDGNDHRGRAIIRRLYSYHFNS